MRDSNLSDDPPGWKCDEVELVTLPLGPYLYLTRTDFTADQLNWHLSGVEAGLGAMFALVFSDMFAKQDT